MIIVGVPNSIADTLCRDDVNFVGRLTTQIADSTWSDFVQFLGFREDIGDLMNAADILVHPTRREGFGLVLAEALAAGLPIVATDVGGIPEVLADTASIMVPPDDPVALRNAVREVLRRTPQEAARYRTMGRQRAEFFRPERRISAMLALFHASSTSEPRGLCE